MSWLASDNKRLFTRCAAGTFVVRVIRHRIPTIQPMPIISCSCHNGKIARDGQPPATCGQCGGTGHLNAPTSDTFKAHFFEHGTYLGRFAGQDYFRSDGSPWGVGPKDGATKKSFNAKDWQ